MASASDFTKKPHFLDQEPTSIIPQIPSKSHSNSLCKSFIIILVLAAIPLFPSQAPEFISQSIFSDFWEIIHLLFIGIALSYGLFCRKSTQLETECVYSRNDGSNAYLSGFLNVPSVFEDGFENPCGSDEKNMMRSIKNRSFVVSENGVENTYQGSGKHAPQTWNYRYLEGQSTLVVEDGKYLLDESIEYKPLNLPIRSLRSRIVDNDKPELVNRNKTTPSSEGKNTDNVKVQKIRGVVPQNLEKKFAAAAGQPPSIPWRSRSQRVEMREEMSKLQPVTRSRPLSVGESEFGHIEFGSFGDSTLCSTPEVPRSYVENVERKKGLKLLPVSGSRSRAINAEASGTSSKTRPFSIGSSSEMNMLRNYDKTLMDCGKEDTLRKGRENIDSLVSDVKLSKVLSRAKSVRTIRNSGYVVDEMKREKPSSQIDDKVEITHYKFELDTMVKKGGKIEELEDPLINTGNQDFNGGCPAPNSSLPYSSSSLAICSEVQTQQWDINKRVAPKYQKGGILDFDDPSEVEWVASKYQKGGTRDFDDPNEVESQEGSGSEFDISSDSEDARTFLDDNSELGGSEVDRKAGEFIAKFREQIRLQKIALAKGNSGC
ncbi:Hypothetical predicted protein [Olea europaea subsp. europaea]|uniref:Uncharacterized protein n=1 Tax=Olea europaea subsp. europaea TaxID=158383 RepID=A0A8S0RZL2_OLEEU|nr:Hypothetical predicted protein [Olea europaea subsp. europaea]